MPFVSCHQRKALDEGGGGDEGIAFVECRKAVTKIGVSSGDGIGQRNEPTLAQLGQDGFPFRIAKPRLCQQFLFRDDGIVDGEACGIEKSVESSLVEILDEDVGIYED
jgi:hypothetical protein